jgi:hypothetical protein
VQPADLTGKAVNISLKHRILHLRQGQAAQLSARVTDARGRPVAGVPVSVSPLGPITVQGSAGIKADFAAKAALAAAPEIKLPTTDTLGHVTVTLAYPQQTGPGAYYAVVSASAAGVPLLSTAAVVEWV